QAGPVAGPAARVADGLLRHVLGAPDADRRCRRPEAVVVPVALADLPRCGAQGPAKQGEEAALALGIELVVVDPEDGARLQREDRAVLEAQLGAPVGPGADRVARPQLEAGPGRDGAQAVRPGPVHRDLAD